MLSNISYALCVEEQERKPPFLVEFTTEFQIYLTLKATPVSYKKTIKRSEKQYSSYRYYFVKFR